MRVMAFTNRIETRPFHKAATLADYISPEELATPRNAARGKLGVA